MPNSVHMSVASKNYLQKLSTNAGHIVGLVLGQRTEARDYILHLSQTPTDKSVNDLEGSFDVTPPIQRIGPADLVEVETSLITEHAKQVTRVLPGGMSVLGIFVAGSKNIFEDTSYLSYLKLLFEEMEKMLSKHTFLCGVGPEKIVIHLSYLSEEIICKSVCTDPALSLKTVDCVVQTEPFFWHKMSTKVQFAYSFPLKQSDILTPPSSSFKDILVCAEKEMASSQPHVNGFIYNDNDRLSDKGNVEEFLVENLYKQETESSQAKGESVFKTGVRCGKGPSYPKSVVAISFCSGNADFFGKLTSHVFMHKDATVGEGIQAMREDILRSLASRLELHADSLTEEEDISDEEGAVLHEPPRRIYVRLPDTCVTVSQYMFPGEKIKESLRSLQELLDINLKEAEIEREHLPPSKSGGNPLEGVTVVAFLSLALIVAFIAFLYQFYRQ